MTSCTSCHVVIAGVTYTTATAYLRHVVALVDQSRRGLQGLSDGTQVWEWTGKEGVGEVRRYRGDAGKETQTWSMLQED